MIGIKLVDVTPKIQKTIVHGQKDFKEKVF